MYKFVYCLTTQHDHRLVVLAALICIGAAFTAFKLYAHVLAASGYRRAAFTTLTAVCMASGIWATHFVAMLAYDTGVPISYEPVATIASLLLAIVIIGLGFSLATQPMAWSPAVGGALVGAGIGVMHYTGMDALLIPGNLTWHSPTVVVSLIVGISLTSLALVQFHKRAGLTATVVSASILTVAICGLHFIAMAAVTIVPDPTVLVAASSFDNWSLALAIAGMTTVLLVSGLAAALGETEASEQRRAADEDFRKTSGELAQEVAERKRLFETSLDLILITDRQGNLVRVSPSCATTLGYTPAEMIGRSAAKFVLTEDLEPTRKEMRRARAGRSTRNFETRYVHKDGRAVTLAWSGVWSEPEQRHFFVGRDMTERKLAEERLRRLAHYDQLTGLPNRETLRTDLGELLKSTQASARALSVALFDLDGFKDINDTLGHSIGDRLLQEVAARLQRVTRGTAGQMYRIGGDELVLVLPDCQDKRAVTAAITKMMDRLAEPFEVQGHSVLIGASVGVATAPQDGTDIEHLLSNADLALYDAKDAGGRTSRAYQPVLRTRAEVRRDLDADLRRAFAANEFVLHYQPQIRLADGGLIGAEALLRWHHPQRGILHPASFIDALAESKIALDVGKWVLNTACASVAAWRSKGLPIRMGINLFPVHFREGNLRQDVEAALRRTGLPADGLELEITENIALDVDEDVLAPLRAIRDMGVGLSFDDFGTGYASLSYLTRCPLSRIKIDRSFVNRIGENATREDGAIVRAIIVLAHNLGLEVIAEGVETEAQEAFLLAERCDEVQGYYYAQPLSTIDFERFATLNTPQAQRALAV